MRRNIFVIADTHFGHASLLGKLVRRDGITPVRPEFSTVEEMDEAMIERWNAVVRAEDKVYHLGDVAMKLKTLEAVMPRLNGTKTLLLGNHDIFDTKVYLRWFKNVRAYRVMDSLLLTHVPVHPSQLGHRFQVNVHGHIHERGDLDGPYLNVSVERTGYSPVPFEEVASKARRRLQEKP